MGIGCFRSNRQCVGMSRGPDYGGRVSSEGIGCKSNRQWVFFRETVGIECFQRQWAVCGDIMQPRLYGGRVSSGHRM